ncbi:MAG: ABC transporter permease [Salinirussus sp.]
MSLSVGTDGRPDPLSGRTLGRVGVVIGTVTLWYGLSVVVGSTVLPGPTRTLGVATDGLLAEGWMVANLIDTLSALVGAFAVAAGLGGAVGILLGLRDPLRAVFEPFVLNTYAIPKIILFPIFLFVFRFGIDQKIAFGAFHGVFPMAIILTGAVRNVSDIHLDVARSLRLSRFQTVRFIVLPSVLGPLVVGLRFAFNLSFLGIILSELFAARSGLGLILQRALGSVDRPRIMGVTLVIVVVALAVNLTFYAVQRVLERRWNVTVDDGGL